MLTNTDLSFPIAYTVTLTMPQPLPTNRAMTSSLPTPTSSSIGTDRASSTSLSSITLGPQQCQDIARDESEHLALGAVDLELQKTFAETICQEISQNHTLLSDSVGDAGILHLLYFKVINSLAYNYEIEWINGCEQTLSPISADKPLPGSDINCSTLWIGDCTACRFKRPLKSPTSFRRNTSSILLTFVACLGCDHNLGGFIDVGCARYTFSYGYIL